MNIGFEAIKNIVKGVAYTEEKDGLLCLHRFTKAQEEMYKPYNTDFYKKTFGTAGVRLEFLTDSSALSLSASVSPASSRKFFSFDVYVNGSLVKTAMGDMPKEIADFEFEAELGKGDKKVAVYFPWSAAAKIRSFSLDEGSVATPVSKPHTMISFGDSITHGYDAKNPSFSYASRLADALSAEAVNKGIGGEVFYPTLATLKDEITPDYITVAYGTNDWYFCKDAETFDKNCKDFYENLSASYPTSKIFAITPIWRGDWQKAENHFAPFEHIRETIRRVASSLPNVTLIEGFDLIPHDKSCFSPDVLHPNDDGFKHYANNLYAEIKKYI